MLLGASLKLSGGVTTTSSSSLRAAAAGTLTTRRWFSSDNKGVDFLSRHRKQTEEDLEHLTEDGWEKKIPKVSGVD